MKTFGIYVFGALCALLFFGYVAMNALSAPARPAEAGPSLPAATVPIATAPSGQEFYSTVLLRDRVTTMTGPELLGLVNEKRAALNDKDYDYWLHTVVAGGTLSGVVYVRTFDYPAGTAAWDDKLAFPHLLFIGCPRPLVLGAQGISAAIISTACLNNTCQLVVSPSQFR